MKTPTNYRVVIEGTSGAVADTLSHSNSAKAYARILTNKHPTKTIFVFRGAAVVYAVKGAVQVQPGAEEWSANAPSL